MTALSRLIDNCPSYDPGSGFAEFVAAARQEQAESVAALRTLRGTIEDDPQDPKHTRWIDRAASDASFLLDTLLSRFPAPHVNELHRITTG